MFCESVRVSDVCRNALSPLDEHGNSSRRLGRCESSTVVFRRCRISRNTTFYIQSTNILIFFYVQKVQETRRARNKRISARNGKREKIARPREFSFNVSTVSVSLLLFYHGLAVDNGILYRWHGADGSTMSLCNGNMNNWHSLDGSTMSLCKVKCLMRLRKKSLCV